MLTNSVVYAYCYYLLTTLTVCCYLLTVCCVCYYYYYYYCCSAISLPLYLLAVAVCVYLLICVDLLSWLMLVFYYLIVLVNVSSPLHCLSLVVCVVSLSVCVCLLCGVGWQAPPLAGTPTIHT